MNDAAAVKAVSEARARLIQAGRIDAAVRLFDLELAALAHAGGADSAARRAELLTEKALLLQDELADAAGALACLDDALALRPGDELAAEARRDLVEQGANWEKLASKYAQEGAASTDRPLATSMYLSAASLVARYRPGAPEAEAYLRAALEADPRSRKAATRLDRLLAAGGEARRADRIAHLQRRTEQGGTSDEQVQAWLELAVLHGTDAPAAASEALRAAIGLDPGHPLAVRRLAAHFEAARDWAGRVALYQGALAARRGQDDAELLLALGTILWRDLGDDEQAEEYFRRLRKLDPAQPVMLDFYRAYYTARGDSGKLMTLLKTAERAGGGSAPTAVSRETSGDARARALATEIAELADAQAASGDRAAAEKAIEAWKQVQRAEPTSQPARQALARLYRVTEKWNALLDLLKEDVERLPDDDAAARATKVERLFAMIEIYRDRLKLDGMVINTYGTLLRVDPENVRAVDELAERFRALQRWNDLITTLTRKAELAAVPTPARVALLAEVAELWVDRFGNFAQAIRPLERILELTTDEPAAPARADAVARLKDIYTRRRQWRPLIGLLGVEAAGLPRDARRAKQAEMARLAMERVGDLRLAIELWNQVLAETAPGDAEALAALAGLYERDKRWLALAEVLRQQAAAASSDAERVQLLERQGALLTDRLGPTGGAPVAALAAEVWQAVLAIDPGHARALRTLREALAAAGDIDGLEALYVRLGHVDELVESLVTLADRSESAPARVGLLERAARLAVQRAAEPGVRAEVGERAVRVWERLAALDPAHLGAARALAPHYERTEKWARLVPALEAQLGHATDPDERLALMRKIVGLCETRLGSRNMAYGWAARAAVLAPGRADVRADMLRLALDPEALRDAVARLDGLVADAEAPIDGAARLAIYGELAQVCASRLGDAERARGYYRQVLSLAAPDSAEHAAARQRLDELATQLADWPALVASLRARAAEATGTAAHAARLVDVAVAEEERLLDLDAAAATYGAALAVAEPGPARAAILRALVRLHDARGDWAALARALEAQLPDEPAATLPALQLRLGGLLERDLGRPADAVAHVMAAYDALVAGGDPAAVTARGDGAVALAGLDRALGHADVAADVKLELARRLLAAFEARRDAVGVTRCLELLRGSASADEQLAIDRRLLTLYIKGAPDAGAAWTAASRVLAAAPADGDVRRTLDRLASHLGRDGELATALATAAATLQASGAPDDVRAVLAERARLLAGRLGDQAAAEATWRELLALRPDDDEAYEQLIAGARAGGRWADVRTLLLQRLDVTLDERSRLAAAIELAALEEDVLADRTAAIAAHRRVLTIDPEHAPSLAALDRLLTAAGAWRELDELLAGQQAEIEEGSALRATGPAVDLRFRRAELHAQRLDDLDGALDLVDEVLLRQPTHPGARALLTGALTLPSHRMRAAQALEPIYKREQRQAELVHVLGVQLEAHRAAGDADAVFDLTVRCAELRETELADAAGAFELWIAALVHAPTDERARAAVPRLAGILGRWPDATAALELALEAVPSGDVTTRVALLTELAGYLDEQQDDADASIGAYRRLLELDGSNPDTSRLATAALARLFEGKQAYADLRDVLRRRAAWIDAPAERRGLLGRIAEVEEVHLADRGAAIQTWRDVIAEAPDDGSAIEALERLLTIEKRWPDLIEHLRQRLDEHPPAQARAVLSRIAAIAEHEMAAPADAIGAYLELLDRVPDDGEALAALARLYRDAGRHADLLDVQERRLALATAPADRLALIADIGQLLGGPLARPSEALERWADALAIDPQAPVPLAAVEAALADPDLRVRATEILTPLYERRGDQAKLEQLAVGQAEAADDPRSRMLAWTDVAVRRERALGDLPGAFDAATRALRASVGEAEAPQAVATVERLAAALDRESDLIDIYRELAPEVLDAELQRRLLLDVADLARGVRSDIPLAREYYQRVLEGTPGERRATLALESIYRVGGDAGALYETLLIKAELPWCSPDDRVAALAEAGALAETPLGRDLDAAQAWEQVLEAEPNRRDAGDALERLYRRMGRSNDLVELYERRLGFAETVTEAVALRVAMAEVQLRDLRDTPGALESYGAALGGDATQPVALAAVEGMLDDASVRGDAADVLEPIYIARQAWPQLVRVYEVKLEAASDPDERLRLTRFLARLHEEQLEDLERASHWYARLFREHPEDATVREQLGRLANIVENWSFVVAAFQQFLDDEPGLGPDTEDGPGAVVRDVALAAATMYERRLDDVERAQRAYRRALAIPTARREFGVPEHAEVLARVEALLIKHARHRDLVDVYDEALAIAADAGDDAGRYPLWSRKARVLEANLDDAPRAIDTWRELAAAAGDAASAGGASPDARARAAYLEAVGELERLYRARALWFDLAELLQARIDRVAGNPAAASGPDDEIDLRLRLADVLEQHQHDLPAAIDQLELVHALPRGLERALPELERLVVHPEHRQRIVDLLEPVYRKKDWWQKLVVVLDAKLEFVDDRATRVGLMREIARIHETRGGDPGLARAALARAWREDVGDAELLREFTALAGGHGAWDELAETLEQGAATSYDPDVVAAIWSRIAGIHETRRDDAPAAIAAWRKALEARSDDGPALAALDRLLAVTGRTSELVDVIERRAELASDAGIRLVLLHRAASLYEEGLARPLDAIGAYRRVLELDENDGAAFDGLDRLYGGGEAGTAPGADPHELATVLGRKIDLATDPGERRALRLRLADVHETRRRDDYEAVAQLTALLDSDARDADALAGLERLYRKLASWSELLDVMDRRALLAPAGPARAEQVLAAARLVEQELSDPDAAVPRYGAVLQIMPGHAGAREALWDLADRDDLAIAATGVLERTYRAERDADGLARVHERRLRLTGEDPASRRAEWSALADVHETMRGDTRAAFDVWARALADDHDELELLGPLERLAGLDDRWDDLAAALAPRVAAARGRGDADAEHALAMRLGALHEDARRDPAAATAAYELAAAAGVHELAALAALERVAARASDHARLAEVLAREAVAADSDGAAADFLFRLGDVREQRLTDLDGAVRAYRDALSRVPDHGPARAALLRVLRGEPLPAPAIAEQAVGALEGWVETADDAAALVTVLEVRRTLAGGASERAALGQRLTEVASGRLGDKQRALRYALDWLADDAGSPDAMREATELVAARGDWSGFAERLRAIIEASPDAEIRRGLRMALGDVEHRRLHDLDAAARTFTAARGEPGGNDGPEGLAVLDALALVQRARGDHAALAEVEWRRGELQSTPADRAEAFGSAAELREQLGDVAGAATAWLAAADADGGASERRALERLAALHERVGDRPGQLAALTRMAGQARDATDERQLRLAIARLTPDEDAGAVAAWEQLLDIDDRNAEALGALERVHARRSDWAAVAEVLGRRLAQAESVGERLGLMQQLARLDEERRGAPDDAIAQWFAILELDASQTVAYDELTRLLEAQGRHHDVVDVLGRRAELEAARGDTEAELRALARAADVWEGPLDDPDAAGEILQKLLRRDPRSVAALTRLSRLQARAGNWDGCTQTLQQALALGPTGRDAADLYVRLAEVAEQAAAAGGAGAADADTARAHLEQALRHDPTHPAALAALEAAARRRGDSDALAGLLRRRVEAVGEAPLDDARLAIVLELADLERKLGRAGDAVPLLERAARQRPDDVRLIGPLADLYAAAGRRTEAAPLYQRLADEARAARRMKDVARYRQRQGALLEAAGDAAGAIEAYDEAVRISPTDTLAMAGLGRLAMAARDWEKARKLYRSLVLQNLDADSGLTKGDVYLALGEIHVALDEGAKAKGMFQRGLEVEPNHAQLKAALAALG